MSRKKCLPLLLAGLLTLAACAAPPASTPSPTPTPAATPTSAATPTPAEPKTLWGFPIDDTHDAFEVPTGGKLGTVLVTVELGEEGENRFFVWRKDNLSEPLQTMTAEGNRILPWPDVVDANFDGYMDFGYVTSVSVSTWYNNYWLWSEEQEKFILEPRFSEIPEPQFEEKTKTISGRYIGPNYESISFYRWEGIGLICVRVIDFSRTMDDKGWKNQWVFAVKDFVEGELTEIHRETITVSEDIIFPMDVYLDEKWCDLSYYGEPTKELWGFPIDDTHDAFEVPTGGRLGTVLVTVEMVEGEYEFMNPTLLSVWNSADLTEPIQVMEGEGFTHYYELMDANFDDHMDFCYTWFLSATNANETLWVWNEEKGKFENSGEFLGYGLVLDEENETVSNYVHGSAVSGMHTIYRWENGALIGVRTVEVNYPSGDFDEPMELIVCDRANEELTEIFRETFAMDGETVYQEATKWYDLSYHGE